MNDNMDDRLERLFAAARSEAVDTSDAEEFFEVRLLARIRERREAAGPWYAAAWRLLPAFAVVAAVITAGTLSVGTSGATDMFAAITGGQEETTAAGYLTGE